MKFDPSEARWTLSTTDVGIAALAGEGAFSRGLDYAIGGKVIALDTADRGRVLMGTVAGNGLAPYQCLVTYKGEAAHGEPHWVARCTCPVASECKHAVATVLAARQHLQKTEAHGPDAAVERPPSRHPEDNVIPLFGGPAATATQGWRSKLTHALTPDPPTPRRERTVSPSSDQWRAVLGLIVEPKDRPTSMTDSTPTQRFELRPTKMMRTGRWSKSVSWVDVRSPGGIADADEEQLDVLRALAASHHPPMAHSTSMYLDEFSADVWQRLRAAADAGITFMLASTPGEGVTLAEPVEVALGVHHNAGGLVLTADVTGVDLEPEFGSVTLLGEPAHGVAILDRGSVKLVPFLEVPHAVLQPLLLGDVIEIPESDIPSFQSEFLPQLRAHTVISDTSNLLTDALVPELIIEITPVTVGKVEVKTSFDYGGRTVTSAPVGRGRQLSSESAIINRAAALLGRLRLTRSVPGFELWIKAEAELVGMEAINLVDAVDELRAIDGVKVTVHGALPAYEEAEDDPIITVGVNENQRDPDWLDLQVTVSVDGHEVPYPNLIAAIRAGEDMMMLPSGTYFRLDSPTLLQIARVLEEAQNLQDATREKIEISRYDVGLWDQLVGLGVVEKQRSSWQETVEGLLQKGWQSGEFTPPETFRAQLRPYQLEGFNWLVNSWRARIGGVLADDMGLGKTVQTLAMLEYARATGDLGREAGPALVIAPTSVVTVWAREAAQFAPKLAVVPVRQTSKKRGSGLAELLATTTADVVVTSYAVARLDAEEFQRVSWRALILDEAQTVKNHTSQTFQAIKKLGAPFGLAISGTPLENSVMDVFSLYSLVAPGLFPLPEDFIRTYRKPIEQGEGHVATDALAALHRRIAPLMLRRRKEQVAPDLPPKQTQRVEVEMSPQHERVYKRHLRREQQRVMGLLKDPDANRVEILAALTRLRRLALDPALVDAEFAGRQVSRKVETVVQQLVEIASEGHRALVFSQFTDFLSIVREAAADAGVATTYLDGSTRNRQQVIDEFKSGEADAFFISLKAGGTGLTLTEADYVIVLDPWWNPAAEDQAIDRAHRIGQQRNVMVYRYVTAETIEGKVVDLQEKKRQLFADVVDAGAGGGKLSPNDIAALLE